jgi:hypothetical protein
MAKVPPRKRRSATISNTYKPTKGPNHGSGMAPNRGKQSKAKNRFTQTAREKHEAGADTEQGRTALNAVLI